MLHQNHFKSDSPQKMDIDNFLATSNDKKPKNIPSLTNKPTNFSIDHILNSAGCARDTYTTNNCNPTLNDIHKLSNDKNNHFFIETDTNHYPPILNWLQYTRYKPPRLPRKSIQNRYKCTHTMRIMKL